MKAKSETRPRFEMQDSLYAFPYHHIPYFDEKGAPRRIRQLEWGLEYLCYTEHLREHILNQMPQSVLDVGCGDGALLARLEKEIPRVVGVDLSERAVALARALCERAEVEVRDLRSLDEEFDVVMAVEVLEHIPDEFVGEFVGALYARVRPGGLLAITVPARALPLGAKHYRHYDIPALLATLNPERNNAQIESIDYVYKRSPWVHAYLRMTMNRFWTLEVPRIQAALWRHVWRHCRRADASNGWHVAAFVRKSRSAVR